MKRETNVKTLKYFPVIKRLLLLMVQKKKSGTFPRGMVPPTQYAE